MPSTPTTSVARRLPSYGQEDVFSMADSDDEVIKILLRAFAPLYG